MAKNEKLNMRAARVGKRAKHLMSTDMYSPYNPENFAEAISNISDGAMKTIAMSMREAVKHNFDSVIANNLALCAIKLAVEDYWHDVVLRIAEKEVE